MPDDFKGKVSWKNQMGFYILVCEEQNTIFLFFLTFEKFFILRLGGKLWK